MPPPARLVWKAAVGSVSSKGALVMYRSILLSGTAVALVAGRLSAQAACGPQPVRAQPPIPNLSHIKLPAAEAAPLGYGSIVGLWKDAWIVDGQLAFYSIAAWHSDGTEFDNVDLSPIGGNICQGVWESKGIGRVLEHHLGWWFDANGNPSGYFTLEQDIKMDRRGLKYRRPFHFKYYDNKRN